ncbi:MAG: lactate utilization protein [Desulfobacter sp.]|uniref:lactate utilization protein n=1 Tax=uncultured Desulfobacter sp. TaxID=240139 RepID=UPI0029C60A4C|nr:lactate utilization protein [uncultured Desulfobacter sp.]MCW8801419.1 lactate utilization protein [Desulfobacter sp.]
MYDQFKSKAESVSAEVFRFSTRRAAMDFIVDVIKQEQVSDKPGHYATAANCPFFENMDKNRLTQIQGFSFDISRERTGNARIGISQVDWALADTGTLVQDATSIDKRLVSTLPEIHIALLPSNRLLPDMTALLEKLSPQQMNYIAMITGPSRTADIERVLTIGVHGPKRLIIILVDDLGGNK